MARTPDIKRISKENFSKADQSIVEKIAWPINSFFEQVRSALDGNLDFNNINQKLITVKLKVDVDGIPVLTTKFKSTLKTSVAGLIVVAAANLTDSTVYPDNAPFLTYAQNGDLVTINHVTGLPAGNDYQLTVLSIGK